MRLFRERGYARTTMRAIAQEAGVAVGNAYYYFGSKDHLIQEFYADRQAEHRAAAAPVLAGRPTSPPGCRGAARGHRRLPRTTRSRPASSRRPRSPLAAEPVLRRVLRLPAGRDRPVPEVLKGSTAKVDPELRRELPELLWLGYMGVVLFWVHDRSPGQARTRRLIDGVVPLIDRLVGLSRLRVLRPVTREVLDLIRTLRH